jgi:hypothetical protein
MAQSVHAGRLTDVDALRKDANDTNADHEAWLKSAALRKCGVHNGQVWGANDGRLYPIPAPVGFAHLAEPFQPFAFQAIYEFAVNRVGQNTDGKALVESVAQAMSGASIPSAKEKDAFESVYFDEIADRIAARYGELGEKATKEEKAARATAVTATGEARRKDLFDAIIASAIEDGKSVIPAKERKRAKAAPKTDAVMEL